ncbi:MAG: YadA-like family protein [Alphaproteobacteria bacterium]|nr:YadA-like family protein [Alphaproteobacteria bacterium]
MKKFHRVHNIVLGVSVLPALLIMPAMGAAPNLDGDAFLFGDVNWTNQNVAYGQAAFGGRRMNVWNGQQYQNDFPQYQMAGRSLTMSSSDIYVGPVTLTLRELGADEAFKFNYQWIVNNDPETDIDLASDEWAGVKWNDSYHSVTDEETGDVLSVGVYEKLSSVIGASNANYTANPVFVMSRRDDDVAAGSMSFTGTTAMIDGSTINADSISVTDGSVLTIANQDHSKLGAFLPGDIDSDGVTTLNARTIDIDGSRILVNEDASLTVNATERATFENGVTNGYGGMLYNMGNVTISNATFDNNHTSTEGYGGAVFNGMGLLTLNNVTFENNGADYDGGAISSATSNIRADAKPDDFTADVINETTVRAYWASKNGFDAKNKMIITDSTFDHNTVNLYSGGALGVYSDAFIQGSHFTDNNAGGHTPADSTDGGGAIYAGGWARLDINDSDFSDNSSNYGGAIATTRAGKENGIYLHISNSEFIHNTATVAGGAIANDFADAIFTDVKFADNTANDMGGAIYNKNGLTIAARNKDVTFANNTANGSANDIYNAGSLALDASAGRLISLAGGIDGVSGTLDIVGDGTVDIANALKNQTVTQSAGELHLRDVDLTGSTIAVGKNATINTIDNAVNDYSSFITLADGASVRADATDTAADKFALATDKTVNLTSLNLLSDFTGEKINQLTSSGKIAVADTVKTYTSTTKYTVAGSSDNSGNITITSAGTGGLFAAADDTTTGTREAVTYSVTADDTTVASAAEIKNADLIVKGNGATNQVSLDANLTVGDTSSLTIEDASFAGAGTIENKSGGVLTILDSIIATNINNAGVLYSDPTTYSAVVSNSGTASFDADTFDTTATLNNTGIVNLLNGVIFNDGAKITGNGVTNLVSGETVFNNTVSSNTVKLAKGADFSGILTGTGALDTRNDTIDEITGGVAGGNLYVDAKLRGVTGAIDTLASSTGATIKEINITDSEYGTNGSYALTVGDALLANDLKISGNMNYFTKVSKNGSDVVFSDKLMNTSGMHNQLGDWADGNYISASSTYDTTTDAYTAQGQTVGQALTALDNAMANVAVTANAGDLHTAINTIMTYPGVSADDKRDALAGLLTTGTVADQTLTAASTAEAVSSYLILTGDLMSEYDFGWDINTGLQNDLDANDKYKIAVLNNTAVTDKTVAGAINANTASINALDSAMTGKQSLIDDENKLAASLIETSTSAQFVSAAEKSTWNGKQNAITDSSTIAKDGTGLKIVDHSVGSTQLSSDVNTLLTKAGTALQTSALTNTNLSGTTQAANLTLSGNLTLGGVTTNGIDTVVTAESTKLITSGAVSTAITNALENSGYQTSENVNTSIANNGQNAVYNANTVQAGTVGKAIKDINDVMGTINGLIASADATTTSNNVTPYSGNLAVGTTVEGHLLALDASIGDMRGFAATDGTGNTYATNTTSVAANLVALDGAAQTNAQAISDLETVVGHASSGTNAATGLFANVETNANAIAVLNGDESVANSVANKIATALADSGMMTTGNVTAAIVSQGQNATYNVNTVQAGTVGKAIADNASAIEDINDSAVMQSGITSEKVALIDTNAADIAAERTRAMDAETTLRNDFASADTLTLVDAKNFAAQRDALTLGAANAYTDRQVEKLDKNLSAGVAGAVALSSVAVSNVHRGEVSVGAGYGYFNGQSAGAFGAAMGLSNRWSVNAGAGVSGYDVSFRAGTNYKFKLF